MLEFYNQHVTKLVPHAESQHSSCNSIELIQSTALLNGGREREAYSISPLIVRQKKQMSIDDNSTRAQNSAREIGKDITTLQTFVVFTHSDVSIQVIEVLLSDKYWRLMDAFKSL